MKGWYTMDEKTINNIKWKADSMMKIAKSIAKDGDKENAEWYRGFAIGVMRALSMAHAISEKEYVEYYEASENEF